MKPLSIIYSAYPVFLLFIRCDEIGKRIPRYGDRCEEKEGDEIILFD